MRTLRSDNDSESEQVQDFVHSGTMIVGNCLYINDNLNMMTIIRVVGT